MDRQAKFINLLHSKGLRATRQRLLVLDVLDNNAGHHDAVAIYHHIRAQDKRIGLATIYRTLALLRDLGLVMEHRLGEEHSHYEIAPEVHHFHFTCKSCGHVIEFQAPVVMEVVQSLSKKEALEINEVHLFINGYCANCNS